MADRHFEKLIKLREQAYALEKMQPKSTVEEVLTEMLLEMIQAQIDKALTPATPTTFGPRS